MMKLLKIAQKSKDLDFFGNLVTKTQKKTLSQVAKIYFVKNQRNGKNDTLLKIFALKPVVFG